MISGSGNDLKDLFALFEVFVSEQNFHLFVCFFFTGFVQEPVFFYVLHFLHGEANV